MASLLLCGCSVDMEELRTLINGRDSLFESGKDAGQDAEDEAARHMTGLSENGLSESMQAQDGGFCYDRISGEDKQLYMEIYTILSNHAEDIKIRSLDADQADRVFQYVCDDHPELFFLDGYSMSKYTVNEEVTALYFSGKYTKAQEESLSLQKQIDERVSQCLAGMPDSSDEYDKAKYIYEYIIQNTEYDTGAPDNQNICSVFLNGRSVCQGYAKAAQYLLQQAGIECALISGTVKGGEPHAWNLMKLNGVWCYMDTTWGDASYREADGEVHTDGINYDFLGADDEQMNRTHRAVTNLALPACDSLVNFYYVREGNYLTGNDMSQIREFFEQAYEKEQESVTIKCSGEDVYAFLIDELITKKGWVDVTGGSRSIRYVRLDDNLTLICYL